MRTKVQLKNTKSNTRRQRLLFLFPIMNTENIYQVIDDIEAFAEQMGSEWLKERAAMLEAHLANLETLNNQ